MHRRPWVGISLSYNIWRGIHKEKATNRSDVSVRFSFFGEEFWSNCTLAMSIYGQLVHHALMVEQVPREGVMIRGHRLPIIISIGGSCEA